MAGEGCAGYASAMTGVHGLASLAEMPINALMGSRRDHPVRSPSTRQPTRWDSDARGNDNDPDAHPWGRLRWARCAVQWCGCFQARGPQHSGAARRHEGGACQLEELNAAINRVPQNQMMPGEAPAPSGPVHRSRHQRPRPLQPRHRSPQRQRQSPHPRRHQWPRKTTPGSDRRSIRCKT